MARTPTASGRPDAGIDLSQFYQVFFEEAAENLQRMEQLLLALDVNSADDEELNAIFRCAHSIKGGAATFGFTDVAELTHEMETLLDRLRRHELAPTGAMVDVLLASGDALGAQLARHRGGEGEGPDTSSLLGNIRALVTGRAPAPAPARPAPAAPAAAAPSPAATPPTEHAANAPEGHRLIELTVGPLEHIELADNLVELFGEIDGLGQIEPLDGGRSADGMRRFKVSTVSSDADLLDLFSFHVSREQVKIQPLGSGYGFYAGNPGAPRESPQAESKQEAGYGFFEGAPGAPVAATACATADATSCTAHASPPATRPSSAARAEKPAAAGVEASTLRVSVEKIDQLINLVSELVITQAMLAQAGQGLDANVHQQFAANLADLDRHTRDLQEAVMSIRMIPMSLVFNRFPRMLRDLAGKLDKRVELVTKGQATELDKGMIEKITDPLTHLVRNACDHGIEGPEERIAKGKPPQGTLTLVASHQGGSVLIEVRDDGRGLSRAKLLKKARERGLDAPDSLTDAQVWSLIFAPGFSTAEAVTDVSGRGVGMDVVKKNIAALGGTVEIDSAEGYGMSVKVRLPLTLAIMDGMSVGVADECYILPLSSVVESFQVQPEMIRTLGGSGRVVQVRDEILPVLELEQVFNVPRAGDACDDPIMVVVESEGARVAVIVDELIGQQQVVVKNLEVNYRKVDDVSGATILGDGRVALILDAGALVRRARH
jgi:two-component system chemotaxis sensor kinase CheA